MSWSLRSLLAVLIAFTLAGCESAEERAQRHLAEGQALLEAGDPVRANLEFRNALKLDDRLLNAHFGLADAAMAQNDLGTAFSNLQRVVQIDPDNVRGLENLGQLLLAANQVEDALDVSVRAIELAPDRPSALALRAALALRLSDPDLAEELALRAIELDQSNLEARGVLAALRLQEGRPREALAELDKGLEADPANISFSLMRIVAFERLGDEQSVGKTLQSLSEQYPGNTALIRQLANWRLRQGDQDGAVATVRTFGARADATVPERISVVEFIAQISGLDAARAELKSYLLAETDPEKTLVYHSAMAELDTARGEFNVAIANLQQALEGVEASPAALGAKVSLASLLLSQGQADQALAVVDKVLAEDPNSVPALGLRGRIAFSKGDFSAAILDLRAALAQAPEDPQLLLQLAEAHQAAGNTELAGDRLAEAANASGFAPAPSLAFARFLRQSQQLDAAERAIEQALSNAPANGDLLRALAQLRLERGDWIGAEAVAETLRQITTETGVSDLNARSATEIQAVAASGRGDVDLSISMLTSLHEEEPLSGSTLAVLVQNYVLAGRRDEAFVFIEKVIAEDSDNGEALVLRGALQRDAGQMDAARASFDEAIQVDPTNAKAYSNRAGMFLAAGRPEQARAIAEQGLQAAPASTEIRMMLAQSLEILGEPEAAIAQYEKLYAARPNSLVVANNLASLLADNRDDEETLLRAFEMARKLQSASLPHFRDTYGWLLHRLGSSQDAIPILEEAAEGLPEEPVVRFHLAAARAGAGQTEAARNGLNDVMNDPNADPSLIERAKSALEALETSETPQSVD